jgi:hypothetical protein
MINKIIKLINDDYNLYNNKFVKLLLIIIIILLYSSIEYYIYYIFIIILIIIKIKIKKRFNIVTDTSKKYNIIKISNDRKRNLNVNIYRKKYILGLCLILSNIKKTLFQNLTKFSLTHNYLVIQYAKKLDTEIPDKCIIICNHAYNSHDWINLSLLTYIFPHHKCIIVVKANNIIEKMKKNNIIDIKFVENFCVNVGFFNLNDNNRKNFYEKIYNIFNKHKKIILIIFPEAKSRYITEINQDSNTQNVDVFNITETGCYNYRNGAFILSLMMDVPIIPVHFYIPVPNHTMTSYDNTIVKIKHINHIGIKIFKPYYHTKKNKFINEYNYENIEQYILENKVDIENYRSNMETFFRNNYIKTLINAHVFNPV